MNNGLGQHVSERRARSEEIRQWADATALDRHKWRQRNRYFRQLDEEYLQFLIPSGLRVLALGCGTGKKLAELRPAHGVGVDFSEKKVLLAKRTYPSLTFIEGDVEDAKTLSQIVAKGPFDIILLDDILGFVDDIQEFLRNIRPLCSAETRVISVYYAYFWEPIMKLAERVGLKMPTINVTWLRMTDVEQFMALGGFQTVKKEWRILLPRYCLGLGPLINKFVGTLPVIRKLSLRHYLVARIPTAAASVSSNYSVSIAIPCRNERGNIEDAVIRIPEFGSNTEIIFVEGHSTDGTWEEIQRVKQLYTNKDITVVRQPGRGKGDAVRKAFDLAKGEILIILDADLTVPPEDLPKFYEELVSGRAEFVNGTRLVYPMEYRAMKFLNYLANRMFALLFTFILNQNFTDTLCGTKALTKKSYQRIADSRGYFGEFDPFGDFDLIFGATKLNLKIAEIPIRYRSRVYGETQISRFSHGLLLIRMVIFAFWKLKVI